MSGVDALIDTQTSVSGLRRMIVNLNLVNTGQFIAYDGKAINRQGMFVIQSASLQSSCLQGFQNCILPGTGVECRAIVPQCRKSKE